MSETNATQKNQVAIFPVPGMVAFEGQHHLLHVFEPRYRKMIEYCVEHEINLGLALPKRQISSPAKAASSKATIKEVLSQNQATYEASELFGAGPVNVLKKLPDGRFLVAVNIEQRVRLDQVVQSLPFTIARVVEENSCIEDAGKAEQLFCNLKELSESILKEKYSYFAERVPEDVWQSQDLEGLLIRVMEWFRLESRILQRLLEEPIVEERAAQFVEIMQVYLRQVGDDVVLEPAELEPTLIQDESEDGSDDEDNVIHVNFKTS
ncbi:LON peptidase substrate-binding domain-containing protein [Pseudobacteriovorax antillogorgiicola]|uniref:Lon protease N-terminal domain-containing protein n=1 Tax=Pseudobacteriovorax antillogorgiicola TaxID=1513793 RepID=A0A1Y6CFM7_9BACT|nr:LON peptidase substrate-binding domain-containing protein [Pseudobacteriovorax antillogorgiicola]TCS47297.1 Lon protease-like protein [Pseudobacteriovorax antillogorgiicola]SMF62437.1 Lon protease N-terminal domain-containing protein [Pseudobacteriovorax antillogorgiicola]